MIALLSGTLAAKEADRVVVRTPTGVGYECFVPTRTLEKLPDTGAPVELHTSLVVREDGYGGIQCLNPGFPLPRE